MFSFLLFSFSLNLPISSIHMLICWEYFADSIELLFKCRTFFRVLFNYLIFIFLIHQIIYLYILWNKCSKFLQKILYFLKKYEIVSVRNSEWFKTTLIYFEQFMYNPYDLYNLPYLNDITSNSYSSHNVITYIICKMLLIGKNADCNDCWLEWLKWFHVVLTNS